MVSMTESDLRSILGEKLKHYRTFRGFSQAKLAEKLDISPNFISDLETGKRWLSSDTLVNIASVLEIEAYELLKPETEIPDNQKSFMHKYNHEAGAMIEEAVSQTLEKLAAKYKN
jgi:transcriptional regulator with XRE-family HTH domain